MKINKLLLAILVLGGLFRFVGTSPGYPPYHSDEGISYSAAVSMIKNENLDPLRYDYPSFVPLVNYVSYRLFFIPFSWSSYYVSHVGDFIDGIIPFPLDEVSVSRVNHDEIFGVRERNALIWGRITTATVGLGAVFMLYLVGKTLFDNKVGLLSALLLAINYRHVLNSHLGLPDVYNSFTLLLSLYMSIRLWKNANSENYLWASVAAGISFATKYQVFAFLPLLIAHVLNALRQQSADERLKFLFRKSAFAVPVIIAFVFIIMNPYAFVKIEETIAWLQFVSSKYRTDRFMLDFFPLSYLYHIAVGRVTSILVIVGIGTMIIKDFRKSLFPISVVTFFFYVTVYMTGGGFYTRNFVTIIPLLLLFAGYFISSLFTHRKKYLMLFSVPLLLFLIYENVSKSYVVASEYSKPWNFELVDVWISDNIPSDSVVAAHPSVPLSSGQERIPFEQKDLFTIQEFMTENADFAVMNLDWSTRDFYWWMTQNTSRSFDYWQKPYGLLEESYAALAIREFSDYSLFSEINPAFAPDSSFVVAKIPSVSSVRKGTLLEHTFEQSKETKFRSWSSEPIALDNMSGLEIEYRSKYSGKEQKDGFVFVEYYSSLVDALDNKNRSTVRISPRTESREFSEYVFATNNPEGAIYAVVNVGVYQESRGNVYFDSLTVFEAEVDEDFDGYSVNHVEIDKDVVFPNSHGNL